MHLKLGKFEIDVVSDGNFLLDGGTMFCMVPKMVWSRDVSVDTNNMAAWGTNCLVISDGRIKVLIETGFGNKLTERQLKMYGRSSDTLLDRGLARLGWSVKDIDVVIPTHLHIDHAGGLTERDQDKLCPRFPKAKYMLQKKEYEAATHTHRLSRGSYIADNFVPVVEAGQEEWLDGDSEILPGIEISLTGAHTAGHQVVKISSQGQTLFCGGDLIPARWFVRETYVTSYDLCPVDVMNIKTRWLEQGKEEEGTEETS